MGRGVRRNPHAERVGYYFPPFAYYTLHLSIVNPTKFPAKVGRSYHCSPVASTPTLF